MCACLRVSLCACFRVSLCASMCVVVSVGGCKFVLVMEGVSFFCMFVCLMFILKMFQLSLHPQNLASTFNCFSDDDE